MIRPSKRYAHSKRSADISRVFRRLRLAGQSGEVDLFLALLKRAIDDLQHPSENVRADAESFLLNSDPKKEDRGLANVCALFDLQVEYVRNLIRREVSRAKKEKEKAA